MCSFALVLGWSVCTLESRCRSPAQPTARLLTSRPAETVRAVTGAAAADGAPPAFGTASSAAMSPECGFMCAARDAASRRLADTATSI